MQLLNPGKAAISKLRDLYRQVLYMKHPEASRLEELKGRLEPVRRRIPCLREFRYSFDFDPWNVLTPGA